jgi:hypothetical protein
MDSESEAGEHQGPRLAADISSKFNSSAVLAKIAQPTQARHTFGHGHPALLPQKKPLAFFNLLPVLWTTGGITLIEIYYHSDLNI